MLRGIAAPVCLLLLFALSACSGTTAPDSTAPDSLAALPPAAAFASLPADAAQPWERLDAAGKVVAAWPQGAPTVAGRDFFLASADVGEAGEAVVLEASADSLAWSMYRLTLGGAEPGTLQLDINLAPDPAGAPSGYHVAVADFGAGYWRWLGPFRDGQLLLELPAGAYLSPVGNCFVAVAGYDGAALRIVAVSAAPREPADTAAPPPPAAPTLGPAAGALELSWPPVVAGDLAGYRVHYSYTPFSSAADPGVRTLPQLEGTTRAVLPALPRRVFVALSAVDHSGNASALSPVASALPRPGGPTAVSLGTAADSALLHAGVLLTASGAERYDFDLDGDGIFELTNTGDATQLADTSQTGLIRPRVRGRSAAGAGESVALGSVSLLVTGNQRPVASGQTTPSSGAVPLSVGFDGSASFDPDGSIAEYAWDRTGDGIYERISATDPATGGTFSTPGLYNAKLRVTDDQGAVDVDTLSVQAQALAVELSASPTSVLPGERVDLSVASPQPPTAVDWDLDGDGTYETSGGTTPTTWFAAPSPGEYSVGARVTIAGGAQATATAQLRVRGWRELDTGIAFTVARPSLAPVAGRLAMLYSTSEIGVEKVWFVRSTSADASSWGAPVAIHTFAVSFSNPLVLSLSVVGGSPACLVYEPQAGNAFFFRALSSTGSAWSPAQNLGAHYNASNMLVAEGRPLFYYRDPATGFMYMRRGADSDGSSFEPGVLVSGLLNHGIVQPAAAHVAGSPAVCFYSGNNETLYYARSLDSSGLGPYTPNPVLTGNQKGQMPSLGTYAGGSLPLIAYSNTGVENCIAIRRGVEPAGVGWSAEQVIASGGEFPKRVHAQLFEVGGLPHCVFSQFDSTLHHLRALSPAATVFTADATIAAETDYFRFAPVAWLGRPVVAADPLGGSIQLLELY